MKTYNYPSSAAEKRLGVIENRTIGFKKKDLTTVTRILDNVRKEGDAALVRYTHEFDSKAVTKQSLQVTPREMAAAAKSVDPAFGRALNRAARQIRDFHQKQVQTSWISTDREGVLLGQMIHPVDAAGIYVPGGREGKTPLVSTVLMCAIPAMLAGVDTISMVTPPMQNGGVNPHLLVAAKKAGVKNIYKAGSAWAIAALAYGTKTIPKADVIVGPGNIYVTLAKKLVSGDVGIDMLAGPSEILIVADESAVPAYIAADLLSQAEHDPLSSSILVTTSASVAKEVTGALKEQLKTLSRKNIAAESIKNYGAILVVPDITTAIHIANRVAPEHLELQIRDPFDIIGNIRHAGAIFIGNHTPEPVGDYIAGPNHVLPTAGTARYASALSVDHFVKKTSLIHYGKKPFKKEAGDIMRLAEVEGLDAHVRSVKIRLDSNKP
jgi:histidinol dehydrogenase